MFLVKPFLPLNFLRVYLIQHLEQPASLATTLAFVAYPACGGCLLDICPVSILPFDCVLLTQTERPR